MNALSTRDALAKALWATEKAASAHAGDYGETFDREPFREQYEDRADALIASGAVVDVATLADDKALRLAVHKAIADRLTWASLHWGTERVHADAWPHIERAAIVGVSAALTERAS